LWGLVYSIDEKILSDSSPALLQFLYSVLAALLLLPFVIFGDTAKTLTLFSKTTWILILGSAVLATIANFMIYAGIKNLNASTVTAIEIAYPCFVILFSFLLYRTVPNIYFLLEVF
jgi:drug/metabolite transporter (DMT)-like permease